MAYPLIFQKQILTKKFPIAYKQIYGKKKLKLKRIKPFEFRGIGEEGFFDTIKSFFTAGKQAVSSAIMATPGLQTAINTIKAKVGEFFQLPARMDVINRKANQLLPIAQQKELNIEAAEISGIITFLNSLKAKYKSTESVLSFILDQLKKVGLGQILSIAVVTSIIAVAASITYLLKSVYASERALDAVQKKILTPEEAQKIFGTGGFLAGLGGLGSPLVIGVVAIGALWIFGVFGGRTRRID